MNLIYFLFVGLVAGWLATKIMKGKGFGVFGNLLVGIIGAFIGGYVFGFLKFLTTGVIGSLFAAVVGAVILLWIIRMFKK
jgi:uncharacterized membrane protein YeaQ/YmgE (transglycosylase-associated protein family)